MELYQTHLPLSRSGLNCRAAVACCIQRHCFSRLRLISWPLRQLMQQAPRKARNSQDLHTSFFTLPSSMPLRSARKDPGDSIHPKVRIARARLQLLALQHVLGASWDSWAGVGMGLAVDQHNLLSSCRTLSSIKLSCPTNLHSIALPNTSSARMAPAILNP